MKCAWDGRGAVGRASSYMQPIQVPFMGRQEVLLALCTVCGFLASEDGGFRHSLAVQALKVRARQ